MKFDLRRRIKQANARTRHTVIDVTHDQNEAMTFADEILVMQAGAVVQRGTPEDLFERPVNACVGTFIGSPGMNFVPATRSGSQIRVGSAVVLNAAPALLPIEGALTLGVRPEHVRFVNVGEDGMDCRVLALQDHGAVCVVELELGTGDRLKAKVSRKQRVEIGPSRIAIPIDRAGFYLDGLRI